MNVYIYIYIYTWDRLLNGLNEIEEQVFPWQLISKHLIQYEHGKWQLKPVETMMKLGWNQVETSKPTASPAWIIEPEVQGYILLSHTMHVMKPAHR